MRYGLTLCDCAPQVASTAPNTWPEMPLSQPLSEKKSKCRPLCIQIRANFNAHFLIHRCISVSSSRLSSPWHFETFQTLTRKYAATPASAQIPGLSIDVTDLNPSRSNKDDASWPWGALSYLQDQQTKCLLIAHMYMVTRFS